MNISEIREKYPQYNSLSDEDLAHRLYDKFYSDKLEFPEFAKRVGYQEQPDSTLSRLGGQVVEGGKDVIRNQATGTLQMDAAATERAITSSERRQREMQNLRSKIEGKPAEKPIQMYTDREHLETVDRMQSALNDVEWLKANPKYLESKGFLEDVARLGPQVISQMIVAASTAGAGNIPFMGTQIVGSSYENMVSGGDSPTRARSAAMANAIMQAPLESLGLRKAMKFIKLRGAVVAKLKKFGTALGTEWLTEFLQAYPEAMTSIWSEDADKDVLDALSETLDKRMEIARQGAYEGLVTLPFTALGASPGFIGTRKKAGPKKKAASQNETIAKGFVPAFRNRKTGTMVETDEKHDLNALPESDVKKEGDKVVAFSQDWIPGYQKDGEFFTPREAEMAIRPKPKAQQNLEKEWNDWINQVEKETAAEPAAAAPQRMTPEQRQAEIDAEFQEPQTTTGAVPGQGVDARQQGAEMARHMGIQQPSQVPQLGYQNFELVGDPYTEPTNKIPYKLRPAIEAMRQRVAEGDAKNYDSEGKPMGSTYPDWFKMLPKKDQAPGVKKGGWSRKEFDRILELAETGQQMTEKQTDRFNELLGVAEETLASDPDLIAMEDIGEETDMMQKRGFTPVFESMAAGRIQEGDQIVVEDSAGNPDIVTHTGYDDQGNAIFKNGTTVVADPFDQIDVRGIKKNDPAGAAESLGLKLDEVQEQRPGSSYPRTYIFTDPVSNVRIAESDLGRLPQRVSEIREAYGVDQAIGRVKDALSGRAKDAIKSLKSERGSWSFDKINDPITRDVLTIGKHIYNKGVTKLKDFIDQLKNIMGDGFKYVARQSKKIFDASKYAVDKFKDPTGEIRLEGNTPAERAANEAQNNIRMVNAADMRRMLDEGPSLLDQAKELVDSGIDDTDMRLFHRAFLTPYFLGKRYASMGKAVDTEIDGRERRTELLNSWYGQPLEDAQRNIPRDKQKMQGLRDLIWKWDNKRFPETEVPDSPLKQGANDQYEIDATHYNQARQFLEGEGVDPDVLDAFMSIRQTLDRVFVDHINEAMENISDKNELQQMRAAVGKIHNYFPHRRYGNTAIKVLDKDGNVVYRRHYNRFNRLKNRQTQVNRQAQEWLEDAIASGELDGVVSDYTITRPKKVQALPDEIFYQVPVDAMDQLIMATAGKVGDETGVDPDKFRKSLSKAVADTFKARGWAEHTIKRRHVAGQDKDDVFGILFDYLSGYAGFKTKVERTKEHHETLRSIDSKNNPNEYRKVAQYVRDMLANTDNVDRVVDKVRGMFFLKYLGAVPKSAMVNLTQNIVAAAPVLSMHTKAPTVVLGKAMLDVRKAMTSYNAWTGKGVEYPGLSVDERMAVKELVESGAANDIFLKELMGNLPGKNRVVKQVVDLSGRMMQVAERFNRTSTGLAGYRVARKNGMDHNTAVEFAKKIIYDSHFLYGKANLPEFARGGAFRKALRSTYTFRSFTHNYLNLLHHLATNQGASGKLAMLRSLRNLALVGGIPSLPFFKVLSDLIMKAMDKDDKDVMTEIRRKIPTRWGRDLATYGMPGLFGVDFSGSLSIEAPSNWKDIIGVPYSVFDDTKNMLDSWESGQKYRAVSETPITPIMVRNAMRGLDLYFTGQRTRSGRDINDPGKPGARKITGVEAAKKIAGMQPTSVSKGYAAHEAQRKIEDLVSRKTKEFADKFVNAYRSGNKKAMQKVMKELSKWNANASKGGEAHKIIDIESAVESRMEPGVQSIPQRQRGKALDIYKQWR